MNIERMTSLNRRGYNNNNSEMISPNILYPCINNSTNISTNTTLIPQPNDHSINYNNMARPISYFHPDYLNMVIDPPTLCANLVPSYINSSSEGSVDSFHVENLQTLLDSLDDPNVRVVEYLLDHEQQLDSPNNDHNHIADENMLKTSGGSNREVADKQRIRWTSELHDLFLDAIQTLGGPQFATPKKILGLMNVKGLSIYHIKSHLQKYRLAKECDRPKTREKGFHQLYRNEPNSNNNDDEKINSDNMTVTEALRMQIELQKLLHDQLKAQRELQISIEQNGEILRKLIEKQNNTKPGDDHSSPSDLITSELSSSQPSASY